MTIIPTFHQLIDELADNLMRQTFEDRLFDAWPAGQIRKEALQLLQRDKLMDELIKNLYKSAE